MKLDVVKVSGGLLVHIRAVGELRREKGEVKQTIVVDIGGRVRGSG